MEQQPQVVSLMYDFLLYAMPQMSKLPRNQRFLLGEQVESAGLSILKSLVAANFSKNKSEVLNSANIEIQQLRFLVRLCKDLKLISFQKYEMMTNMLFEIGKQVGGWLKSISR